MFENYRGFQIAASSPDSTIADRTAELGAFIGPIIGGIYEGIRLGIYEEFSDFEAVIGRPHQSWNTYFASLARWGFGRTTIEFHRAHKLLP